MKIWILKVLLEYFASYKYNFGPISVNWSMQDLININYGLNCVGSRGLLFVPKNLNRVKI